MVALPRGLAGCCMVVGLAGCKFPYPADVASVGGSVTGLWTGAAVTLRLTAGDAVEDLPVDGSQPFTFATTLLEGSSYLVAVVDDGPDHDCVVSNGSGRIEDGDVTDLEDACTNLIPHSIAISTAVPFTFDPRVTRYPLDVSILQQETIVTVTGGTLTSAKVAGQPLTLGQPSAPVPLGQGQTTVTVEVVKGPLSQRYELVFGRGGAPIVEALYGRAIDRGIDDNFGLTVAASGDYAAIGAIGEASSTENGTDDDAFAAGAVYIYKRSGQTWLYAGRLKGSAITQGRAFGSAVATDGDVLVVGAYGASEIAQGAGAVYVFRLDRGTGRWQEEQRLTKVNASLGDEFGRAVAVSGDRLAVGVPGDDAGTGIHAGSVLVYQHSGSTWTLESTVRLAAPQDAEHLGYQVSLDGDNLAAHVTGSAEPFRMFRRAGATWTPESLPAGTTGQSIDLDGDWLAIGEPSDSPGGSVRIFNRVGAAWVPAGMLKATNPMAGDEIGNGVAIRGNVVVASAWRSRSLQVFERVGGSWIASAPQPVDGTSHGLGYFGGPRAVALSGIGAVIGDASDDGPANDLRAGAVWFFR